MHCRPVRQDPQPANNAATAIVLAASATDVDGTAVNTSEPTASGLPFTGSNDSQRAIVLVLAMIVVGALMLSPAAPRRSRRTRRT